MTDKNGADDVDNIHEGHRERLKRRFLESGLDSFYDHAVLELLLGYCIPRRDVNPLAHRLIDTFGSLSAVFDADIDALEKVSGVGEHTAVLIRLIPALSRRYMTAGRAVPEIFDTLEAVGDFLVRQYVGVCVETVYLMLLDNKYSLIGCRKVCEGSVNSVGVTPRVLVETALFAHASAVVLAHNHPSGLTVPSGDDIRMTRSMQSAFSLMGITMLEHIIVSGGAYEPVMLGNQADFGERMSGGEAAAFFNNFYALKNRDGTREAEEKDKR